MRTLSALVAVGLLDLATASFAPLHSGGAHLSRRAAKSAVSCKNGFHYTPDRSACLCPEDKYISLDGKKCLSHCSLGSYILPGNPDCQPCPNEESWARCSSSSVATACKDGFFLSNGACVERCPTGTWEDGTPKNRCRPCADPDAITCSSAKQGATTACLTKYLFEGVCIDADDIPDGYFPNMDRHVADPCGEGIATCTGNGDGSKATSCKPGRFLTEEDTCDTSCPSGSYGHTALHACLACDSSAKTCDEDGAIECAKTQEGNQLYLTPHRNCILPWKGEAGYYADDATYTFKECDEGVSSCIGSGPGGALQCGKMDDDTPLFWTSTSSASNGTTTTARHRKRGDTTPVAGSCVEADKCPAGTWADPVTSSCVACDDGEASCRGNGAGSAITCKKGLFLTIDDDCVSAEKCKASGAFFPDTVTNACSTCDPGEASCDGNGRGLANSCAKNEDGDQLYLHERNCVVATDCPGNYYPDQTELACKPCDPFVLQCKGPGQALACGVNSNSTQLYLNIDGTCVEKDKCDASTYADPRQRDCASCTFIHPDAKTCTSPFTLSCKTLFYQDADCVPAKDCRTGTYGRESDHTCSSCVDFGSDVATCDAGGALSCKTSNLQDRRCVAQCKTGNFAEDHVCHACTSRFDFAAACEPERIIRCDNQHFLQDGVCVEQCSSDRFATPERTCLPCTSRFPGSATCSTAQPLTCLPSHVFLAGSPNQCRDSCPDTHYEENGICQRCSSAIPYANTCSSKTVPTSCSNSRFVDKYNRCSPQCRTSTDTWKEGSTTHWYLTSYIDGTQNPTQCKQCSYYTLECDMYTGKAIKCYSGKKCD
ncbi:hypothetical protein JCM6882_009164 [Rhodosporidiobolus microsporus]